MITGELEHLYALGAESDYDYFFRKLFKKKTTAEKAARKKKRKAFWANIGKGYQDIGGTKGIATTVGSVKGFIATDNQPSDVKIGIGHGKEEEEKKTTANDDKGISTEVIIIGSVAILAIGAWGYSHYRKNQALKKQ